LSRLDAAAVAAAADAGAVIFHCQSGMRTATNAGRLAACCTGAAYVLDGGLNAWRAAGLPVRA
jgi:rhodanese-related sulfurtransferase